MNRSEVKSKNPALACRIFGRGSKVFAYSEDTHSLRLASELADLRSGYVNLQPFALLRAKLKSAYPQTTKETYHKDRSLLLAGVARFELTNEGVKVPCLTAWRYPYEFTLTILP